MKVDRGEYEYGRKTGGRRGGKVWKRKNGRNEVWKKKNPEGKQQGRKREKGRKRERDRTTSE